MAIRENKGRSLVDLLEDYIVLDLETTGLDPSCDEIIEIAAVKVCAGSITENFSTLVKARNPLDDFIIELTGITDGMLADAPTLESVLPAFFDFVGSSVIVGHNVNFDVNFLYDNLQKRGSIFSNDYIDTMRLSRLLFKDFVNHKLTTLVNNFGVTATPTHRALADCFATQGCYDYIKQHALNNKIDLQSLLVKKASVRAADIAATVTEFDESHPLFGKVCAFTGTLTFTRKEAMQLVANVGGINADGVNKQTNFLIIGSNEYCTQIKDGKSNKQKKAEAAILAGQDLTILSEAAFVDLLKDSQVKTEIPIPENQMPAAHYAYACAVSSALASSGVNTEYLRFSVDGDRLDALCMWLAFRIMICKKITYIVGFGSCADFLKKYPEASITQLAREYRILLSDPADIAQYATFLANKYAKELETLARQISYHPTTEKNLKYYLGSQKNYKV